MDSITKFLLIGFGADACLNEGFVKYEPGESDYEPSYPLWTEWSPWSECITGSPFYWCFGKHHRHRNCSMNSHSNMTAQDVDQMTIHNTDSIFGKDNICGSSRYIFGWSGLSGNKIKAPEKSLQAKVEDRCHVKSCMVMWTQGRFGR